jgi:hypothetical protein
MGFTSAMTYDFEVFSTAQDRWLEISSVSNFETFQANRLKLRFRDKDGRTNSRTRSTEARSPYHAYWPESSRITRRPKAS